MKKVFLSGMVMAACLGGFFAEAADRVTLPEVVVYGQSVKTLYADKNTVRETDMGVMGNKDFMDVPIQVMSLSQHALQTQRLAGSTFLETATLNPTVISDGDNTFNDVTIRGFRLRSKFYYLNGVPGMISGSSIPVNMVERVEIISGPSTLLSGTYYAPSAGGSVNLVPKVADRQFLLEVTEGFSGKNHFTHEIDIGRRFGENQSLGIRINGSSERGEMRFVNEKMNEDNLFMNLDYQSEKTNMQLLWGHRNANHNGFQAGIRLNGHSIPKIPKGNPNYQVPWGTFSHNNNITVVSIEHKLDKGLMVFLKGGRSTDNWDPLLGVYFPVLQDEKGNFKTKSLEGLREGNVYRAYIGGLRWERNTDDWKSELVFSLDRLQSSEWDQYDQRVWDDTAPTYEGNIYDSQGLSKISPDYPKKWTEIMDGGTSTVTGYSLLERLCTADEKWGFLFGVRHQKVQSGSLVSKKYSPNYGIMYSIAPKVKLYANYLQGLGYGKRVKKQYSNAGEYLPPQTTEQREVGVKWDEGNFAGSFSTFFLEQENYGVEKKTNRFGYFGRQRNKGAQLTVFGKLSPKLSVTGGIMYLNSTQFGGKNDGKRIIGLPRWNFSIASEYELSDSWSLTGRVLMQDGALVDYDGTRKTDGWCRVGVGAQYRHRIGDGYIRVKMNIHNLFNTKVWLVRDAVDEALTLSEPRSVTLVASYEL